MAPLAGRSHGSPVMRYLGSMKYALLLIGDAAAEADPAAFDAFCQRLRTDGAFRGARRFAPANEARSVRAQEGGPTVTPGPTNAGAEQVTGFVLAELETERLATDAATQLAEAAGAIVEVRPVAAPGEGGPDASREGVQESTPGPRREFAFLMNVEDAKRPWPGSRALDDLMERCGRVLDALQQREAFRGTERLLPSGTARTVRAAGGKTRLLDGPFTEARELIGGFILGECDDMQEAVALAALLPGAATGSVEVREVVP